MNENYFTPGMQYKQLGGSGPYGEPVWGNVGYSENYLLGRQKLMQDKGMQDRKWNFLQGLFGQMGGMGSGSGSGNLDASFGGLMPPKPNYLSAGPVWSQGQVDAESNLQRGTLTRQAMTGTNQFANQLGARGFSPLSPLAGIVGQQNQMRANAGAASNETQLNFGAAKANSDARLQAGGINAGLYGDYVKSMLGAGQLHADTIFKQQQLKQSLLQSLLGAMG